MDGYALRTSGEDQPLRHLDDLEAFCRRLADHPVFDRPRDQVRPGLRRMDQGAEHIFPRESQWRPGMSPNTIGR